MRICHFCPNRNKSSSMVKRPKNLQDSDMKSVELLRLIFRPHLSCWCQLRTFHFQSYTSSEPQCETTNSSGNYELHFELKLKIGLRVVIRVLSSQREPQSTHCSCKLIFGEIYILRTLLGSDISIFAKIE